MELRSPDLPLRPLPSYNRSSRLEEPVRSMPKANANCRAASWSIQTFLSYRVPAPDPHGDWENFVEDLSGFLVENFEIGRLERAKNQPHQIGVGIGAKNFLFIAEKFLAPIPTPIWCG